MSIRGKSNINKKVFCNCNYILFTKLPWPGDSEGTFWYSSQAATCPPVYHTRLRLHTVLFNAERQAGKLWIPIFIVFGLTQLGIEPESTASVADALSIRPLPGCQWFRHKVISSQWFCHKVIRPNMIDSILQTKQALWAYLPTPLYWYYCIIKIKALTKNSSHQTNLPSPELSCPNPHLVVKSLLWNHFVMRSLVTNRKSLEL